MRRRAWVVAAAAAGVTASLTVPAGATPRAVAPNPSPSLGAFLGDGAGGPGEADHRGAAVAPPAARTAAAQALGAGVSVDWNEFGTPRMVSRPGGWVATDLTGTPADAARSWLSTHSRLFGLSTADVAQLTLVNDSELGTSGAHAVLFRQTYAGGYNAANGGLVTVGIRDGKIASVTSSLAGAGALNTTTPALTPAAAFVAAAKDVGRTARLADIGTAATKVGDFTTMKVAGFAQPGLARLVALPLPGGAVRLAYETDVQDTKGGSPFAVVSFVDAVNGKVLLRHDAVDYASAAAGSAAQATLQAGATTSAASTTTAASGQGTFTASYTATACGTAVPLNTVAPGSTTLDVEANDPVASNDFALNVFRNGVSIGSSDTATSPEAVTATLSPPSTAADKFTAQACPSTAPIGPFAPVTMVIGTFQYSDQAVPAGLPYPPKWKTFANTPNLTIGGNGDPKADVRTTYCWSVDKTDPSVTKDVSDCNVDAHNVYARQPWDVDGNTGQPTLTTIGNLATTAEARTSPLTPAEMYRPTSPTRDYVFPFGDQWHQAQCNPAQLATPQGADGDAAVTNLNVGHDRIHDWSYRLGFTERNYNLQTNNFGNTAARYQNDSEVGNVQAGAVDFGGNTPSQVPAAGRDNANQIALQDGVPGITNQYLFQPVVGFYAGCTDGDLDGTVFLHEYTHAISNRMIAGPDTGLSGQQAGSMGESWSDLDAIEFLNEFDVAGKRGEDRYDEGAYVTGDNFRGIRDYNLLANPLNYSDFGFDSTGPEVHADGEIWNAVMMHVRQGLIDKYNPQFPESDKALQLACATGFASNGGVGGSGRIDGSPHDGFNGCPGNRRWIQYMYDAFLLQASGTPTMVDMKDEMLAAQQLRTGGADFDTMATEFARYGVGAGSKSNTTADTDPQASFASPVTATNAAVTFALVDSVTGAAVPGQVFVGRYEARATPVASTTPAPTKPDVFHPGPTATLTAGQYELTVQAPGYGAGHLVRTYTPGQATTETVHLAKNLASATNGATVVAVGAHNPAGLIDDTEATDAGYDGSAASTPVAGRAFTVALGGGRQTIDRVQVSAEHHPVDANDSTDFQGRLLDLRAFDVLVSSDGGATYNKVLASPDDAFPAKQPRPVVPDIIMRSFTLTQPVQADHVRLVVRSNQCTGQPLYKGVDGDPTFDADCTKTVNAFKVTAAELQVFGSPSDVTAANGGILSFDGPAAGSGAGPNPVVPEVPFGPLLPVAALAVLAGGTAWARRRGGRRGATA